MINLTLELTEDIYFLFNDYGDLDRIETKIEDRENSYKFSKGIYRVETQHDTRFFLTNINTREKTSMLIEDFQLLLQNISAADLNT